MTFVKSYRGLSLIIFWSIWMTSTVIAQNLTNQTNIYISPGLDVYFDGDVTNQGFLQQQGNFSFTGNWLNENIYQGNGSVLVIGDRAQSINNNRQSFSNLVIDGTGNKRILGLLPITDKFELLSGLVLTTTLDTLFLSSSTIVSGGSDVSFVDGPLFSEGLGYKFFPIGKNGKYNPVELNDVTGVNPVFALEVFENAPEIQTPPRINYFPSTYWRRSQVFGTFNGSSATIHFDLPDRFTDSHDVEILQSISLTQPFARLTDVSVMSQNTLDLISTDDLLHDEFFMIGSSIPIGGVEGEFYFSTALSPKAIQEENRAIKIFGNKLSPEDFLFQVYNRWGLLVFESATLQEMIDIGWTGTKNGEFVPAGAYPFVFKAKLVSGETFERKGVITVVY